MLAEMEDQLKSLINQRLSIKASLMRFKKFFEESRESATLTKIRKRYGFLYDKYVNIQNIEEIVEGIELESIHAIHLIKFENVYFNIIFTIEDFRRRPLFYRKKRKKWPFVRIKHSSLLYPAAISGNFISKLCRPLMVLLRIGLVSFVSLVQNNKSLSNLQRFHYLRASLKNKAARTIQSLDISEANYRVVWENLQIRYEKIANFFIYYSGILFDLPLIKTRLSSALREFVDDTKNHFRENQLREIR